MGLSTLSATLLRRFAPFHKSLLPPRSKTLTASPPTLRRLRSFRDLPPAALADALYELDTPLSPSDLAPLITALSADPASLAALIALLLVPPPPRPDLAPRRRLPRAWVVATLVRFGPPALRTALAARPDLLRLLPTVFDAPPGRLDPAVATNIADLLRVLLHDFPRHVACALYATPLVPRLVAHLDLQPAADLLPRLVAHRVFAPGPFPPAVPMHKKAVAMLGEARVQRLLAGAFADAARELPSAESARRQILVRVVQNAADAMAEISARAMCVPRKYEDVDERSDHFYAGHLGIVTSHAFNDAKDHMTLLTNVQPLADVLHAALKVNQEPDVLLAAFGLVVHVLESFRAADKSPLLSVRHAIKTIDLTQLANILTPLAARFAQLLDEEGYVLGRRRLAVIDLIKEMCDTLPEASVADMLSADDFLLFKRLLATGNKYARNDILQVRLSQVVSALLTRCEDFAVVILLRSDVLDFLHQRQDAHIMDAALGILGSYAERLGAANASAEQLEKVAQLTRRHEERRRELDSLALSGMRTVLMKKSSDMKDLNVEGELSANEDFGQELFLHHLMDEVSSRENRTPPLDTNVAESAAEIAEGWGKGLSGRLKVAVHHVI